MAKQMIKALTMLTLTVVLSLAATVVSANAQSSRQNGANVPFDFVVGDSEMQAGNYRIDAATSAGDALKISGDEKAVFRLSTLIVRFRPATESRLVFHRYGNQYFLAEVWTIGSNIGRQLLKSTSEKAVERELSAVTGPNKGQYERVEIALVQR
jgi:hypothetical protein